MSADEVRTMIRAEIEKAGLSQTKFAKAIGVSQVYLSQTLAGDREPAGKILERFGLQRVVSYQPV